ncbi:hypothetical protein J2X20_004026 [Pelomonas saccharophila]|uniref:Uncharacterized protein n=1 Tax=Roseateles saccharophilus TaxID=304 RepID=A0ABU1YR67_ROSSA|nr:hypothetical protein [Roseateles saccharophilus]MDR7271358.1 hypothetical protein [Roseateles saccharophilus]
MTFKRRWRWLGWLLSVLAGALLSWQPWRDAARPAPGKAEPGSLATALWGGLGLGRVAASGADGPAGATSDAGGQAPQTSFEVCGVGRASRAEMENAFASEGVNPPWMGPLTLRKDTALSALAARLAVGSDAEQTAARLLMGDTQGAALIAARSRDATAYRLALAKCGGGAGGDQAAPNCAGLSIRGWAQLDPEDARPWMSLAAKALWRRDDAAAAQALDQVLLRRRRSPSSPLLTLAINAREGVMDEAGLGLAVIEIIGVDAAQSTDEAFVAASRYCSAEGIKDASRRHRCERLARWQFEHADSYLDAMLTLGIADRVGLPAEQRPYTREQLDRGMNRMIEQSSQILGFDCASLRRTADWVTQRARQGELRMALKAAGADR